MSDTYELQTLLNEMIQEGLLIHEFDENGESCYSATKKGKKHLKSIEKKKSQLI